MHYGDKRLFGEPKETNSADIPMFLVLQLSVTLIQNTITWTGSAANETVECEHWVTEGQR